MPRASGAVGLVRPKLQDVAALAGVSPGTVSNALNHPEKVAPETMERIQSAIGELGFRRNSAASTLASGKSTVLGLVVIDLMNSLFVDITRGAQETARMSGFDLQLADSDNDESQQGSHLQFFESAGVAGVLLAPVHETHASVEFLRAHDVPVVLVNHFSEADACCTVLIDNEKAGYMAARHLIELGRRRIAFVGGQTPVQPVQQRRKGVLRALNETNGAVELLDVPTADLNGGSGAAVGARFAAMSPRERPDGVLAVTDLLGSAIIGELMTGGITVPQQVAVMGCDHNSVAWGGAMPMTSVAMRGREMGRAGVELMVRELRDRNGAHEHRTIVLEPELVRRESTIGR
ncbi:LacI family DNA-binding transcriptional regulator [Leifsonia sp. AG29]|uniref:LacI family DNA-binding transcriptional regulator n=1 Tax=Leifsonia sp. AG29 TaxID=2598860 RepID=UPI00131DE719|nr:LacI family DNA-binding transcriptional regulator [Leifsonia sp. AG29]